MRKSTRMFILGGLLIALGLAFFASPLASPQPDGLNRVAIDQGLADAAPSPSPGGGPLAGYGVKGVEDPGLSKGIAGAVGVAVTFGIGLVLFGLLRRRSEGEGDPGSAGETSPPEGS
jgi:hypothetical protein